MANVTNLDDSAIKKAAFEKVLKEFVDSNKEAVFEAIRKGAHDYVVSEIGEEFDDEVAPKKQLSLVRASEMKEPTPPQYWYLQRWNLGGNTFWDSYVHRDCYELKRQPYSQSPFQCKQDTK